MHDASEAYLGDVSSPLKCLLPEYKIIESRLELAIRRKFLLPEEQSECVIKADLIMLATEKQYLMPVSDVKWEVLEGVEPLTDFIEATWNPISAKTYFLDRFFELVNNELHNTIKPYL